MSKEKYKLHPIAAIINFAKALKDALIPIVIIIAANGFNFNFNIRDENFFSEMIPLLVLSLLVGVSLVSGLIKWWTFKYWFEDSELRVEYGLFVRKKRYIPFDRIQSLNYKESIFHRLFGLVQVMVETAGGKSNKPEAELTAITKQAADEIESRMKQDKQGVQIEELEKVEPVKHIIHKMKPNELLLLATTSSGIGIVLASIFAVISQFAEFIPFEFIFEEISSFFKYGVIIVAMLVAMSLLLAWVLSVAMTFLNYYDFTVVEENNRIVITRGLLEKKRITIPLQRVQAIKIVENPFRQMLGLAAVIVESAGGGFKGEADKKIVLFPLIKKANAIMALQQLFPHLDFEGQIEVKPPLRARSFFYRIDFVWLVPLIGGLSYFFFPYGLLSILLIAPIILLGVWQFRTEGFTIKEQQLTVVSRNVSRTTFIAEKSRIQVAQSKQSYFQKRKQLATANIVVMSGMNGASAKSKHMEREKIEGILQWFER